MSQDQIQASQQPPHDGTPTAEMLHVMHLLWRKRRPIALATTALTLCAVIIVLLVPKYYSASSVLLPQTDQSPLASLAGLTGLASFAGINVGQTPIEDLFPQIMQSEAVLREVIYAKYHSTEFQQPVNLIEYWGIAEDSPLRDFEVALKKLQKQLDISVDRKTNVITITLLMKEPQLAADVVNKVTSELDSFVRTKRSTQASEQKKWIEGRLAEVKEALRTSEDALKDFREKNHSIQGSPDLSLTDSRLSRDVDMNSSLFLDLSRQYEMAKIEEVKNIPVINILDSARPAAKKSKPQRTLIVVLVFIFALAGNVVFVVVMDRYREDLNMVWRTLRRQVQERST